MRQAWQLAGRGLLAALATAVVMSAAMASLILSLPKVWGVACMWDASICTKQLVRCHLLSGTESG